jgi:hypothetical protein
MKTNIRRRAALASIFGGAAMLRAQSSTPSTEKALPAGELRNNHEALDSIEQLAMRILKEVSGVRSGKSHAAGEDRGTRLAMQAADVSEARTGESHAAGARGMWLAMQAADVSEAHTGNSHAAGETRGMWRAMQPVRRY